jgi:CP12 domain
MRIISLRTLLVLVSFHGSVLEGFAFLPPSSSSSSVRARSYWYPMSLNLYREVEDAISEAQQICLVNPDSPECKVAWDIVEELEAADSHMQAPVNHEGTPPPSSLMDVQALLASFDILTNRLDDKMDQLIATCDKFEEWGADPSVAELSQLAQQMKVGMAYVKDRLNNNQ